MVRTQNPDEFIIGPPDFVKKRITVTKTNDGKLKGFEDLVERLKSELAEDDVDEERKQSIIENAIIFANQNESCAIKFINQDFFNNIQFNISYRETVSVLPNDRRTLANELRNTFKIANKGDLCSFPIKIDSTNKDEFTSLK